MNMLRYHNRDLSKTAVHVRNLNPNTKEEHLRKYRLFRNAIKIELSEKVNKKYTTTTPLCKNGIITFATEQEKQQCLIDCLYFSGQSLLQATIHKI